MKTKWLLASLTALGAITLAAPASAQSSAQGYDYRRGEERAYGGPYAGRSSDTGYQIERLRMRVRLGVESGRIGPAHARGLYAELRDIDFRRAQYLRTRGLSRWEMEDLQQRLQMFRMHMRRELADARGGTRSYERFGADDRYAPPPMRGGDVYRDDRRRGEDWRGQDEDPSAYEEDLDEDDAGPEELEGGPPRPPRRDR